MLMDGKGKSGEYSVKCADGKAKGEGRRVGYGGRYDLISKISFEYHYSLSL